MGNRDHLVDKTITDKNGVVRRTKVLPNGAVPSPGNIKVASVAPASSAPSRGTEVKNQFASLGDGETDEQFINMLDANGDINVLAANNGLLPLRDRDVELFKNHDSLWTVTLSRRAPGTDPEREAEVGKGETPAMAYRNALGEYLGFDSSDDGESPIVLARINEWDTESDDEDENELETGVTDGEVLPVDIGYLDENERESVEFMSGMALDYASDSAGWTIHSADFWLVTNDKVQRLHGESTV